MANDTVVEEVEEVEEVAGAVTAEEAVGVVEEGLGFIDEAAKAVDEEEGPGFIEEIAAELDDIIEGEPEGSTTEEAKVEKTEVVEDKSTEGEETDLVEDFPKAEDLKGDLDEKAQIKWGELRSELGEERKKVQELEQKLDATQNQSIATELEEKLAEARSTIDTYEKELSVSRVEQTQEYKRVVSEPLQSVMDAAEALAKRNEVEVDRVFDILAETSNIERQTKAIEALTEGMSQRDQHMLYRMVDDAAALFQKDAHLKANAAEAMVEIEGRQAAEDQQAAKQVAIDTRAAVNKVYGKMENVMPTLLNEKGEEIEFSSLKDKTLAADFVKLGADHKAYALSAGTVLPPLIRTVHAQKKEIAELTKQLAGFQKATPKAGGGGGTGVKAVVTKPIADDVGFMEGVTEGMGGVS